MVDSFNLNTKKKLENVESFINNTKDTLVNAFGPNPLSTPIGIKVDLATSPDAGGDNWALYLEICDLINVTQEGPKDAARAIRKKLLMSAGKYNNAIDYTLNLLDTCVKNCGHRFHVYVAAREFIQDLVKVLNPKYNPSLVIQEKILNLIEAWALAFKNFPDLQGVVQVNEELKTRGIEAPSGDLAREKILSDAPIFTPPPSSSSTQGRASGDPGARRLSSSPPDSIGFARSSSADAKQWKQVPAAYSDTPDSSFEAQGESLAAQQHGPGVSAPYTLEEKDVVKLRKELDVVRTNAQVLGDLLSQNPEALDHEDRQLIEKLFSICRDMQSRIVELLDKVSNEDFIGELLGVNDELNNVFVRYAKYARGMPTDADEDPRARSETGPATTSSTGKSIPVTLPSQEVRNPFQSIPANKRMPPPVPEEKPLIDLGDEPNEGSSAMFDRLDPFANPAALPQPNTTHSKSPYVNDNVNNGFSTRPGPPVDIKDNDIDNINLWLKNKPYDGAANQKMGRTEPLGQQQQQQGSTSQPSPYDTSALNDDFEKFLLERTNNVNPTASSSGSGAAAYDFDKPASSNERKIY